MASGLFQAPNDRHILSRFAVSPVSDLNNVLSDMDGMSVNTAPYMVKFSTSTSNIPSSGGGFCIGFEYTANSAVQIACVAANSNLYLRVKSSGTWGSWNIV